MKLKTTLLFCVLILAPFLARAQADHFHYKRSIEGISSEWHKISLPDELFGKLRVDFNDIRIFGVTEGGDTIEAPYILKTVADKSIKKEIQFKLINQAKKGGSYYSTCEISDPEVINEMDLDFKNKNFDWKVTLEGSQDQAEWFELLADYRILSIKNDQTDYSFTKLNFPPSNYRFLRVKIDGSRQPILLSASISHKEMLKGKRRHYDKKAFIVHEDKRQTILDITPKSYRAR